MIMINLLPPQEKERLVKKETERMVIIWGFIIAVFLVSFAMSVLFTSIQVSSRAQAQELLLEGIRKELENPSVAALKKELISANRFLTRVEPFLLKDKRVSRIFSVIASRLPPGLYVTRLSYNQPGAISLEGFSPTRQALLIFKQNLEEEAFFSKVDFPPSNWIKPEDINFVVNLNIDAYSD